MVIKVVNLKKTAQEPGAPLAGALSLVVATVAAFTLGVAPLTLAPRVGLAAQCTQPSLGGCPLENGRTSTVVLTDADQAHLWRLSLAAPSTLRVLLTGLQADYRLYVYGPDGSLVGISDNRGVIDEVVVILGARAGEYQAFVDSPAGEVTSAAYGILASVIVNNGPDGISADRISIAELQLLLQWGDPVVILDARDEDVYDAEVLQAAESIRLAPEGRAADRAAALGFAPDAWLVAYCT